MRSRFTTPSVTREFTAPNYNWYLWKGLGEKSVRDLVEVIFRYWRGGTQ